MTSSSPPAPTTTATTSSAEPAASPPSADQPAPGEAPDLPLHLREPRGPETSQRHTNRLRDDQHPRHPADDRSVRVASTAVPDCQATAGSPGAIPDRPSTRCSALPTRSPLGRPGAGRRSRSRQRQPLLRPGSPLGPKRPDQQGAPRRLRTAGHVSHVVATAGVAHAATWTALEIAPALGTTNINSFQGQMATWSRQGRIAKVRHGAYTLPLLGDTEMSVVGDTSCVRADLVAAVHTSARRARP